MKRVVRFALLVVTVSFLASCATTGPKFLEYQTQMASSKPELGRIYFYRPSSFGAALRPDVLLNGEKVGEAIAWGFFYIDRPPGEYVAVTSTEVTRKASFILEKGQTRYIKFSVSMGFFVGHVYGKLVDESVALSEIRDCRYTGGKSTE
ncbi:MAG: DUF2846 domain-containing protein [Desulfobacterales bacterium]|nr:DUF2846 domain-containing protein [Desulfobacterales bacterium]